MRKLLSFLGVSMVISALPAVFFIKDYAENSSRKKTANNIIKEYPELKSKYTLFLTDGRIDMSELVELKEDAKDILNKKQKEKVK